jgi:hypothetical protein
MALPLNCGMIFSRANLEMHLARGEDRAAGAAGVFVEPHQPERAS